MSSLAFFLLLAAPAASANVTAAAADDDAATIAAATVTVAAAAVEAAADAAGAAFTTFAGCRYSNPRFFDRRQGCYQWLPCGVSKHYCHLYSTHFPAKAGENVYCVTMEPSHRHTHITHLT